MHSKVLVVMFRPHSSEKSRKTSHMASLSDKNHTDAINSSKKKRQDFLEANCSNPRYLM